MTLETHPGQNFANPAPPDWGELSPAGQTPLVVRFTLEDRVVSFPLGEFRRWEHVRSDPELLTISTAKESIVIEGRELGAVCAALDLGRLCAVHPNHRRSTRPGPRIVRIAIEPA